MTRPPFTAVLLMLVAMALIPAGDTAGKLLITQQDVSPWFVAWSRFALGAAAMLTGLALIGAWPPAGIWWDRRLWLRGLLIAGGIASILTALRTEPIANVFGAFFVGPIFSAGLSAAFLGERLSPMRIALLALGFAGVLLVVRPGFGMTPGLGFAVLAGLFYGAYLTASRALRDAAPPSGLLLTQLVVGTLILSPVGLGTFPTPSLPIAGLTLVSALSSMLGNLLLVIAYGRATSAQMAPFVYFQLVAATGFGLAVFGDTPDRLALTGLAVITLAGVVSVFQRR